MMIGLLQRVTYARVTINENVVGEIGPGLLALIGVQQNDTGAQATRLAERLLTYRVFGDDSGKMNLNVTDIGGGVLLVPQFTLAADTQQGNRPRFSRAAATDLGKPLFEGCVDAVRARWDKVETGQFGADMNIELLNQGPVTFWLEVPPPA
jgi:D-tyrosyl-tRNA(Tyr) deacylase